MSRSGEHRLIAAGESVEVSLPPKNLFPTLSTQPTAEIEDPFAFGLVRRRRKPGTTRQLECFSPARRRWPLGLFIACAVEAVCHIRRKTQQGKTDQPRAGLASRLDPGAPVSLGDQCSEHPGSVPPDVLDVVGEDLHAVIGDQQVVLEGSGPGARASYLGLDSHDHAGLEQGVFIGDK